MIRFIVLAGATHDFSIVLELPVKLHVYAYVHVCNFFLCYIKNPGIVCRNEKLRFEEFTTKTCKNIQNINHRQTSLCVCVCVRWTIEIKLPKTSVKNSQWVEHHLYDIHVHKRWQRKPAHTLFKEQIQKGKSFFSDVVVVVGFLLILHTSSFWWAPVCISSQNSFVYWVFFVSVSFSSCILYIFVKSKQLHNECSFCLTLFIIPSPFTVLLFGRQHTKKE